MRYILGELSQEEREKLEEQYFVNEETWSELQAVETDLIDCYLRNDLTPAQRAQFEKHFLASPRRQRRLEFARLRMDAASLPEHQAAGHLRPIALARSFVFQIGFAMAAAVLIVAVVILSAQNSRLRGQFNQARSQQANLQRQLEALQKQAAPTPAIQNQVEFLSTDLPTISLLLSPGTLRGGQSAGHILPLSSAPSTVLLLLELSGERFPAYEAEIQTVEGKEIRRFNSLKATQVPGEGPVVMVKLPSRLLVRGDYIATLFGKAADGRSEVVDSFSFTAVR